MAASGGGDPHRRVAHSGQAITAHPGRDDVPHPALPVSCPLSESGSAPGPARVQRLVMGSTTFSWSPTSMGRGPRRSWTGHLHCQICSGAGCRDGGRRDLSRLPARGRDAADESRNDEHRLSATEPEDGVSADGESAEVDAGPEPLGQGVRAVPSHAIGRRPDEVLPPSRRQVDPRDDPTQRAAGDGQCPDVGQVRLDRLPYDGVTGRPRLSGTSTPTPILTGRCARRQGQTSPPCPLSAACRAPRFVRHRPVAGAGGIARRDTTGRAVM